MMRVLRKRASLPRPLTDEQVRRAKERLADHYRLPPEERARRRPPLEPDIWKSALVQEALYRVFLSKCAYCETALHGKNPTEIVHHRPLSNALQNDRRESESHSSDHYSWFAYEWENLFHSCVECNRSKRNIFPVEGPRARIRSTWSETETFEQALLINPCNTEPNKHLRFEFNGTAIGVGPVGRGTIDTLALNRSELVYARAKKLQRCLDLLQIGRGRDYQGDYEEFRTELEDSSEFSGVARIFFFNLMSRYAQSAKLAKPKLKSIEDDAIELVYGADDQQWQELLDSATSQTLYAHDEPLELVSELRTLPLRPEPRTSLLRRISIRNFKGIPQLDLDIPATSPDEAGAPCATLLGENSTGKSTTLQAVALSLMGDTMRTRLGVSAEDFLPREVEGWYLNDTVTPEVVLEFDTGEPIRFHIDPLTKRFVGEEQPALVLFAFGARRFFGKETTRRQHISAVKSLFDPFAKLPHPGRWLQSLDDASFDALARAMREVLILKHDDNIGRDAEGRLYVHAHGRETPLERLSDGYRSLMAMVLAVMRGMLEEWGDLEYARGLVLIDEIETHLHPRWKLQVMSALRRAMPNVQFIVTTHDPLCLRGMRGDEVKVLVRNETQTIEVLNDLPDVRGLRAEQLLTSDYFGLSSTADPDLEQVLEQIALPAHARSALSHHDQRTLGHLRWLGDTPAEQILNEALRRFIEEMNASSEVARGQVREEAVQGVLAKLKTLQRSRRP